MRRRDFLGLLSASATAGPVARDIDLPDPLLLDAYHAAAAQNVLAAVNPEVFPGYFSVCADGHGFGYGNTYPSLDGHQMSDALLWLRQVDTVTANWDYVKTFQREDGRLPLAILPSKAGQDIGPKGYPGLVEPNGALYTHWVPGDPLAALSSPTYIQNADVIFRRTLDLEWLRAQIASINRAAGFLASLVTPEGRVKGGGYYVERPSRLESDGVTQPHAMDAFRRAAALNRIVGDAGKSRSWEELAGRIQQNFQRQFWRDDHFIEYIHPQRGPIDSHGLSDTDWAALAFGAASPDQERILWPRLRTEARFRYGGMPTGIVTEPANYQAWEFSYPDQMDLAAMGRVWYVESQGRARMRDAAGLLDGLRKVAQTGRDGGWYWRERYTADGGRGAGKYCEYPANLIRIVQRFLLGVDLRLDGSIALHPLVTPEFHERGFGQRLEWREKILEYRMRRGKLTGNYSGREGLVLEVGKRRMTLPAAAAGHPHRFTVRGSGIA